MTNDPTAYGMLVPGSRMSNEEVMTNAGQRIKSEQPSIQTRVLTGDHRAELTSDEWTNNTIEVSRFAWADYLSVVCRRHNAEMPVIPGAVWCCDWAFAMFNKYFSKEDSMTTDYRTHIQQRISPLDLDNFFTYHAPKGDQQERYVAIRDKAKELADVIVACRPAPIPRQPLGSYAKR